MDTQPPKKTTPASVFRDAQARATRAKISPDEQVMHDRSAQQYPELSLSPGEYVLEVVHRHPIGLVAIWFITGILVLTTPGKCAAICANRSFIAQIFGTSAGNLPSAVVMVTPALILAAFFLLGGLATYVYNANKFYITTESIIQFVQYSLFNKANNK